MRSILIKNGLIAASVLTILSGCSKERDKTGRPTEQQDLSNKSLVQAYVATVNASRNAIYVDGALTSGAVLSSGSVFPTAGTAYAFGVDGGLRSFLVKDTLTAATQVPLVFAENLQAAKNYTIFLYDSINAPKQKTVITDISIPADTTARIRFANFVHTKVAIPAIDIYSYNKKANVATNLQVTDVTDFIPYQTNVADTFAVRLTGTTTDLTNSGTTPVPVRVILTPREKRHYTLVFRGSFSTTVSTAAQARTISSFVNY